MTAPFVDTDVAPFSGLKDTPTVILATGVSSIPHTLYVDSIVVCNKGEQPIRFSLTRSTITTSNVTTYQVNQLEIPARGTTEIVKMLGLEMYLIYKTTPATTSNITCFSNGYTQVFDCTVNYKIYNELPMT